MKVEGWDLLPQGKKVHWARGDVSLCGRELYYGGRPFTDPRVLGPVDCKICRRKMPGWAKAEEAIAAFEALPWWRRLLVMITGGPKE